jgi:histidyl-tRNA synthetase
MASTKTQPARGMRDFLPDDVRKREYVIGVIKEVYERYGFEPLETPAVENIETLMGKYGEEGNQLIFKILKRGVHEGTGEADLALRYDLTVPLARVVAEYREKLPKFFKRYQIQPVWRADRPARGRFREFYQCDVDVLGSRSMVVEAELINAASDALKRLGFKEFTIRLNHRQVLAAALAEMPEAKHEAALVALDKLDKVGKEGVYKDLLTRGVDSEAPRNLLELLWQTTEKYAFGDESDQQHDLELYNADILGGLKPLIKKHEGGLRGLSELEKVLSYCIGTPAEGHIKIDPSLARGLSYYTGAIMEIRVRDLAGSLGGGGRYDNLVGMFLGQDVPACGFSLGLERILVVMSEREMFPSTVGSSRADVMVAIWNEDFIPESIRLAHELRAAGLRVDLYPEADKLGKQFKYASSLGVPFVAVLGDHERARGEVAIKDMRTGEQRAAMQKDLATILLESL